MLLTFFTSSAADTSNTSLRSDPIVDPLIAGDTVELQVFAFDQAEQPIPASDIVNATYTILQPDGTLVDLDGIIRDDGSSWIRVTDTSQTGVYRWVIRFVLNSGEKKSFSSEFKTYNPLAASLTRNSQISEEVWRRLEDCFDSELGGPLLRDTTLSYFGPQKIDQFIAEGLLLINMWPPITNVDLSHFTTPVPDSDPALPSGSTQPDPDRIIVVQATLLAVIKHLMRSYVEQPSPQGANIVWQSKRDYLERWGQIYQIEEKFFKEVLALWKRSFMHYGQGSLLVGSKAGRLVGYNMRSRNAARGYW